MNYGKRIELVFDREVSHVSNAEIPSWALRNAYGEDINPTSITYGANKKTVHLNFADFNSIVEPVTLECLGCIKMGSPDLPFDAFSFAIQIYGLYPIPCDFEFLEVASITIEGELQVGFSGELFEYEYLQVGDISIVGDNIKLSFIECNGGKDYLEVANITIEGQYCDIDGVPL